MWAPWPEPAQDNEPAELTQAEIPVWEQGTGSTQRGFDPPEPLRRKLEKVQLAEGEQRGSRKAALIATAPQSLLRGTTSNGRAQTQGWRVSDWVWG